MASHDLSHTSRLPVPDDETINHHDLCPVCHSLLYRPVTTTCAHNLCESCMQHWASISSTNAQARMETFTFDELPEMETTISGPSESIWRLLNQQDSVRGRTQCDLLDASCPMCRTKTSAVYNPGFAANIRARYPVTYAQREKEERENEGITEPATSEVFDVELLVGNKHKIDNTRSENGNRHDWVFFVKPQRSDFIKEVDIHLHPTFRQSRLRLIQEPFEAHRLGWGYFTIMAHVILKRGYTWLSGDAEPGPDGREKGMLHLEWTLDFQGSGSFGRIKARVQKDNDVWDEWSEDEDDADEDEEDEDGDEDMSDGLD